MTPKEKAKLTNVFDGNTYIKLSEHKKALKEQAKKLKEFALEMAKNALNKKISYDRACNEILFKLSEAENEN